METNSFNAVFGARLRARISSQAPLHKLSLQTAPRHKSIAPLLTARLSISLTREEAKLA